MAPVAIRGFIRYPSSFFRRLEAVPTALAID
jgi:hypothetical protein